MPEDAEDRFKRAMDRLFSSPATPPSSVAGQDRKEAHTGKKLVPSVANLTTRPPRSAEGSPLGANLSSTLHRVCRPWDRGDLFRRLATFKSMTWFGKPEVAGPVSCARKGWINVEVDLIACEGCNSMLGFPSPPTWSQQEAERMAASFSEKLDSGHKAFCPWKENACSETLAQFPPTPVEVLAEGFKDRCDGLYQLPALPVLSSSAIDFLKMSKGSQMDRLLSQPASSSVVLSGIPDGATEGSPADVCTFYQAQKIISLCGWELRLLPYIVDCEDDNTESVKKSLHLIAKNNANYRRGLDPRPDVLLYSSKKEGVNEKGESSTKYQEQRCDVGSAILDCTLCGASVGLWLFSVIPCPSSWTSSEPLKTSTAPLACGFSAASGIERGSCDDEKGEENAERPDKVGDAVTSSLSKSGSKPANALNLKLTIAGGPPPTRLNSHGLKPLLPNTLQLKNNEIKKSCEGQGIKHVAQTCNMEGRKINMHAVSEEKDGDGMTIRKRKRDENTVFDEREAMERKLKILPCLSSVDAVDTCFHSRQENSAESVEMPQESYQNTAVSGEDSDFVTQRSISGPAVEIPKSSKNMGTAGYKGNASPSVDCDYVTEEAASDALLGENQVGAAFLPYEQGSSDNGPALEGNFAESGKKCGRHDGATVFKSKRTSGRDPTDSCETAIEAMPAQEKTGDLRKLWEEDTKEFDPILQHRHFCPWVNANLGRGLCGWELTLDALEASSAVVKSESASSIYNADPLSSVRKIFGRTQTSQKGSKKQ